MAAINYTTFPAPFIVNPRLTGIVIAYKNPGYIADQVLPRVPVNAPQFLYSVYDKATFFEAPSVKPIGRKGAVPEIDWSATQTPGTVNDYGFDEVVPRWDQEVAMGTPFDPKVGAAQRVAERLMLQREIRATSMLANTASYATGNTATLSGTSQWSDQTNSDPLSAILNAFDGMLKRPNKGAMSRLVATKLMTHPKLVQAHHANNGAFGKVPLQAIADLLELDEIFVSDVRYNTANKGQTAALGYAWGKSASFFYQEPVNFDTNGQTFGVTAQWGQKITGEYFDENKGLRGSDIIRAGESVGELILAPDLGYLFQNAIA